VTGSALASPAHKPNDTMLHTTTAMPPIHRKTLFSAGHKGIIQHLQFTSPQEQAHLDNGVPLRPTLLNTCQCALLDESIRSVTAVSAESCSRCGDVSLGRLRNDSCWSPVSCAADAAATATPALQLPKPQMRKPVSAASCSRGRQAAGEGFLHSANPRLSTAWQQMHSSSSCCSLKGILYDPPHARSITRMRG
jgi:hypothetical protein